MMDVHCSDNASTFLYRFLSCVLRHAVTCDNSRQSTILKSQLSLVTLDNIGRNCVTLGETRGRWVTPKSMLLALGNIERYSVTLYYTELHWVVYLQLWVTRGVMW